MNANANANVNEESRTVHYKITTIPQRKKCENCGSNTRLERCAKPKPETGWACSMRIVSYYDYDNRGQNYPVSYPACQPEETFCSGLNTTKVEEVTCPACLATPTVLALLVIEGNARVEHGLAQLSSAVVELTKAIERKGEKV